MLGFSVLHPGQALIIDFLAGMPGGDVVSSVRPIRRHVLSVSPVAGEVNLIILLSWCLPGFSSIVTNLPFAFKKYNVGRHIETL